MVAASRPPRPLTFQALREPRRPATLPMLSCRVIGWRVFARVSACACASVSVCLRVSVCLCEVFSLLVCCPFVCVLHERVPHSHALVSGLKTCARRLQTRRTTMEQASAAKNEPYCQTQRVDLSVEGQYSA